MKAKELQKLIEEFLFWEKNYSNMCIEKKMTDEADIPNNEIVIHLLNEFKEKRDYYSIMHRRAIVRKKMFEFIEDNN